MSSLLSQLLTWLGKNLKFFGPGTRNTIGITLVSAFVLVFIVFAFHAFAPTYVLGRLTIKTSKNGPVRFAKDYVLTTGESEIVVDKFGRWMLPLRGLLPSTIKLVVHNPNKPGEEFARIELYEPIPIKSALAVSEPEVTIHTYREENRVEIANHVTLFQSVDHYQLTSNRDVADESDLKLTLVVRLQDIGEVLCQGTDWCGTIGEKRKVEGFALMETGFSEELRVEYMARLEDGTETAWIQQRGYCGTRDRGLGLQAVAFRLVGGMSGAFNIKYQVHVRNQGTLPISENGKIVGSNSQQLPVEAIRLWIEKR